MRTATALVVALAVGFGTVGYFVVFLFAYGFRDDVGTEQHAVFLTGIAVIAVFVGLASSAPAAAIVRAPWRLVAAWTLALSFALNLAAVGAGSVVSALNKDAGSVSEDFSVVTDVMVAGCLFAAAAAATCLAKAARRRVLSATGRR